MVGDLLGSTRASETLTELSLEAPPRQNILALQFPTANPQTTLPQHSNTTRLNSVTPIRSALRLSSLGILFRYVYLNFNHVRFITDRDLVCSPQRTLSPSNSTFTSLSTYLPSRVKAQYGLFQELLRCSSPQGSHAEFEVDCD